VSACSAIFDFGNKWGSITPAREIHREQLGKLEAERGPNFWVLGKA
jgi:hypothetical protein